MAPGHANMGVSPSSVHAGDGHVGVEHGVLLDVVVLVHHILGSSVDLDLISGDVDLFLVNGGVDLLDVSPDDLEPPGVLWVEMVWSAEFCFQCNDTGFDHRRRKRPFRTQIY